MGELRRPELPPGRLKELNDALHDLHLLAGQPSVRDLERALGRGAFSHSRIYDVFSRGRLPRWGMVDIIVKALSEQAPGLSASKERRHFQALWIAASRNDTEPVPQRRSSPQAERSAVGRYMAELSDAGRGARTWFQLRAAAGSGCSVPSPESTTARPPSSRRSSSGLMAKAGSPSRHREASPTVVGACQQHDPADPREPPSSTGPRKRDCADRVDERRL